MRIEIEVEEGRKEVLEIDENVPAFELTGMIEEFLGRFFERGREINENLEKSDTGN